jgi:RNA polymerase sigma-70 factor (ECF subfamily)
MLEAVRATTGTDEAIPDTGAAGVVVPGAETGAEAQLVGRAQRDRAAFAALYDRYVGAVYAYCLARLGSREAAEDATSVTFARALAALPTCRDDRTQRVPGPWLFSIAHNATVDAARRLRPSAPLAAAEVLPDGDPGPEERAFLAEGERSVAALLDRLPADQARVVALRLAGLSGREIAAAIGRSHPAVKMLQLRAIRRLRALLTADDAFGLADWARRKRP